MVCVLCKVYIMIVFLQINHPKYNQRRVSCVKFLGELYNYRMVESAVIFKTLYSFITFGVSLDGMLNIIFIIYKTGMLFSSPEPKAQGELLS